MAYKSGVAIGIALAERAAELGLTYDEAGKRLGTSGSVFGRWVNLKTSPGDERMAALAEFLGWDEGQTVSGLYHQRIQVGGHSSAGGIGARLTALERRVAALEGRDSP